MASPEVAGFQLPFFVGAAADQSTVEFPAVTNDNFRPPVIGRTGIPLGEPWDGPSFIKGVWIRATGSKMQITVTAQDSPSGPTKSVGPFEFDPAGTQQPGTVSPVSPEGDRLEWPGVWVALDEGEQLVGKYLGYEISDLPNANTRFSLTDLYFEIEPIGRD